MITKYKILKLKNLYIFFLILSLKLFFFSTTNSEVKAFEINNIEISKPFEINFNKNRVIDEGFNQAFLKLILLIVSSSDQKKINNIKLNEIKGMIDTFSIKQEKFINEIYHVNLGVSFNKKKVFKYLEKKNIFPSIPIKKKILFIPIIIDENKRDLLIFNDNIFFEMWNDKTKDFRLLKYILPTEDLEDLKLVKSKFEFIEQYDFEDIIDKYYLKDSIIALIFKNEEEVRILSKISMKEKIILKNKSFSNIELDNIEEVKKTIEELKIIYEDYWKSFNQINTSIRISLNIRISNSDNFKISNFENVLKQTDLIYDFNISKLDKNFVYYQIIFNGTPSNFLESMRENNLNFNTENKVWVLR